MTPTMQKVLIATVVVLGVSAGLIYLQKQKAAADAAAAAAKPAAAAAIPTPGATAAS